MCISGDVPAALLTLGSPDDVAAYCRRLIDEVGEGGGFMLTTGCECPVDVKPENLRAMVQTGLEYRGGRRTPGDKEPAVAVEAAAEFTLPAGEISEAFSQLLYDEVKAKADDGQAGAFPVPATYAVSSSPHGGALVYGASEDARTDRNPASADVPAPGATAPFQRVRAFRGFAGLYEAARVRKRAYARPWTRRSRRLSFTACSGHSS